MPRLGWVGHDNGPFLSWSASRQILSNPFVWDDAKTPVDCNDRLNAANICFCGFCLYCTFSCSRFLVLVLSTKAHISTKVYMAT